MGQKLEIERRRRHFAGQQIAVGSYPSIRFLFKSKAGEMVLTKSQREDTDLGSNDLLESDFRRGKKGSRVSRLTGVKIARLSLLNNRKEVGEVFHVITCASHHTQKFIVPLSSLGRIIFSSERELCFVAARTPKIRTSCHVVTMEVVNSYDHALHLVRLSTFTLPVTLFK